MAFQEIPMIEIRDYRDADGAELTAIFQRAVREIARKVIHPCR